GSGYIYVGTEDGLYRYDGERFVHMGVADGLPSESITLLHGTSRGELWVATEKGLIAWPEAKGPSAARMLLPATPVLGVSTSDSGRAIVATPSGFFEGDASRLVRNAALPPHAGAAWIAPDASSSLFAVDGRLYRRDGNGMTSMPLPSVAAAESAQAVAQDRRGRIWIRGRQMLLRMDAFGADVVNLGASLPGAAVQKGELALDDRDRVWAPTNHGIVCFDGADRRLIDAAHGLPNEWATSVLVDREGSVWVASEGIQQLQGRMTWSSYTRKQGLPSDTVWAITRDRDGELWVATNRGVAHATASGWMPLPNTQDRSFYAFAQSATGDLWIGGNSGHSGHNTLLFRARGATAFRTVALSSAIGPSTINSLAFGPDNALYVATIAHGLHRITRVDGRFASQAVPLPGGVAGEQVNQLARDESGRLWAAGMRGLAMFDGRQWRRFGLRDGLLEQQVETVTPVAGDGVWITYWNVDGLTRVRATATGGVAVRQVSRPESLVADTIYSAGPSRHGGLWFGTAMGIKRWQAGVIQRFGRADGLPGDDAAANAFLGETDGTAWFGMANGLARFDAHNDRGIASPPRAVITAVQDAESRTLAASVSGVDWASRALTFHVAALGFLDPGRIQRQVRLLGFEDAWRDTSVSEARYTGLLPGHYRFQVRARYGAGKFGPTASRDIDVRPPWWLTWWFLGLAVVSLVVLAALALRWRLARLRAKNAQLEALVDTRTRDLQAAYVALEQASMVDPLTGLKNRRYLSAFMPEEIARCLRRQRASAADGMDDRNIDLCLLMLDLDHFKAVNDSHGHAAGDAVLRQVGDVLRATCRDSDVVVRWGGEEFLVLARNADRDLVQVIAAQICESIRAHAFDIGGGVVLRKTCSIGFTAFPLLPAVPDRYDWEQAVALADRCLYAAKHSGRDGWVGCLLVDSDAALAPVAAKHQVQPYG
ncbi:MAG TPA: diguanylate cyclase, partial [Luteimonas sp.]|nr:diguanylate cyclase [Luteimonas sp.]